MIIPLDKSPILLRSVLLPLGEKEKFLNEASAFFAIKRSDLTKCWNLEITEEEKTACIQRIPNWDALASEAQNHLTLQILLMKQKQAFLSLLTESARSYFDEDFRSREIFVYYPIQMPLPLIKSAQTHAAQAV
jgi:hypothetical protein